MSNIKKLREQAGLSKIFLAKMSKISRQYLAEVESGAAIPSVTIANRIARSLNCTIENLDIQDTKEKPPNASG